MIQGGFLLLDAPRDLVAFFNCFGLHPSVEETLPFDPAQRVPGECHREVQQRPQPRADESGICVMRVQEVRNTIL